MPSFAAKPNGDDTAEKLKDLSMIELFSGPNEVTKLLDVQRSEARLRAKQIIIHEIPARIKYLQSLIDNAHNEDSLIWKGQLEKQPFLKADLSIGTATLITKKKVGSLRVGVEDDSSASASDETIDENEEEEEEEEDEDDDLLDLADPGKVFQKLGAEQKGGGLTTNVALMEGKPKVVVEGGLKPNEVIAKMAKVIETESEAAIDLSKELGHWLSLEIPKVEDGNNFGVDVQMSLMETFEACVRSALKARSLPRLHHDDRLNLAMKAYRYPELKEETAIAIASSDKFDFYLLQNSFKAMRSSLVNVLHKLQKNWEKVIQPKGVESRDGMY